MNTFNNFIEEAIKVVNGGKMLTFTDGGSKLTMAMGQQKDTLNISLDGKYFVLTGKEVEDVKKLFK